MESFWMWLTPLWNRTEDQSSELFMSFWSLKFETMAVLYIVIYLIWLALIMIEYKDKLKQASTSELKDYEYEKNFMRLAPLGIVASAALTLMCYSGLLVCTVLLLIFGIWVVAPLIMLTIPLAIMLICRLIYTSLWFSRLRRK